MKLVGSRIESEIRDALVEGRICTSNAHLKDTRIIEVLSIHNPDWETAYILSWVPNQDWEHYTLMCDEEAVIHVEYNNRDLSEAAQVDTESLKMYRRRLKGKPSFLTLEVALELLGA